MKEITPKLATTFSIVKASHFHFDAGNVYKLDHHHDQYFNISRQTPSPIVQYDQAESHASAELEVLGEFGSWGGVCDGLWW